ncbi:hypothetical protein E2C01_033980 [Portunus trituberculatus]|uniref:Uncharacterized protein n=1 Tax=Portunus trituberculatus TaxID=210409 RepID=A0A5B7F1L0_PORTR|nr:hypothetical protein [Portunus trituberculatus]
MLDAFTALNTLCNLTQSSVKLIARKVKKEIETNLRSPVQRLNGCQSVPIISAGGASSQDILDGARDGAGLGGKGCGKAKRGAVPQRTILRFIFCNTFTPHLRLVEAVQNFSFSFMFAVTD